MVPFMWNLQQVCYLYWSPTTYTLGSVLVYRYMYLWVCNSYRRRTIGYLVTDNT